MPDNGPHYPLIARYKLVCTPVGLSWRYLKVDLIRSLFHCQKAGLFFRGKLDDLGLIPMHITELPSFRFVDASEFYKSVGQGRDLGVGC